MPHRHLRPATLPLFTHGCTFLALFGGMDFAALKATLYLLLFTYAPIASLLFAALAGKCESVFYVVLLLELGIGISCMGIHPVLVTHWPNSTINLCSCLLCCFLSSFGISYYSLLHL